MGKVTREQAIAEILLLNEGASPDKVMIYVDAMLLYLEATENITKNGAIVSHPRTGAPMDNPYLKVRDGASKALLKHRFETGGIFEAREEEAE